MTIETLFLMIVTIYLVLVAYGAVGARRRGLGGKARIVSAALMVAIPPVALLAVLLTIDEPGWPGRWPLVVVAMALAGGLVALLVELIAPRLDA